MIELPFPPASLSGHNKGHWHAKSGIVTIDHIIERELVAGCGG